MHASSPLAAALLIIPSLWLWIMYQICLMKLEKYGDISDDVSDDVMEWACALRWLVNLKSGLRPNLSRLVSVLRYDSVYLTCSKKLIGRLHMTIGMQTGLQTGVSSVYTGRLVCKPVCQPIVVTFTQGDWFAYRYAYRFCKPGFETLFTYLATPTCVIMQCLRRLQMEEVNALYTVSQKKTVRLLFLL